MNVVIPPLIFYLIGAVLVVGGTVRAARLGRRNAAREIADDDPVRARSRRRHLTFGLIWIGMGIFLIVSTAGILRSKWGPPAGGLNATPAGSSRDRPAGAPSSTIRLDPSRPTTLEPPAKR
jgi:hypothetical protein